jgi:hypothetical protein
MPKVQGEGDYVSGRKYQQAQHRFAKDGPVDEAAREAADAVVGPEAEELEAARRATAKGRTKAENVRHRERNLDEGLDETFPASDPVSISPGSD